MAKAAGATQVVISLKNLAAEVAENHELPKKQVQALQTEMIAALTTHLQQGARIRMNGLGTLEVRNRPARTGRNPATGEPWGLNFPVITIRDMVRAQAMLLDHLGVPSLFAVAGGSMGGMQVLQWVASYPERVFAALPIAPSTRQRSFPLASMSSCSGSSGSLSRSSARSHAWRVAPSGSQ